jgi:ribosomal protein L37AE/L43A
MADRQLFAIALPPWAEQVNALGVERVARAVGHHPGSRLLCVYCGGWAAIREDDRIWNCSECEETGTAFTLAAESFWKQTKTESPSAADWARLVRMLVALGLCRG